jgi:hypothetical protein
VLQVDIGTIVINIAAEKDYVPESLSVSSKSWCYAGKIRSPVPVPTLFRYMRISELVLYLLRTAVNNNIMPSLCRSTPFVHHFLLFSPILYKIQTQNRFIFCAPCAVRTSHVHVISATVDFYEPYPLMVTQFAIQTLPLFAY